MLHEPSGSNHVQGTPSSKVPCAHTHTQTKGTAGFAATFAEGGASYDLVMYKPARRAQKRKRRNDECDCTRIVDTQMRGETSWEPCLRKMRFETLHIFLDTSPCAWRVSDNRSQRHPHCCLEYALGPTRHFALLNTQVRHEATVACTRVEVHVRASMMHVHVATPVPTSASNAATCSHAREC